MGSIGVSLRNWKQEEHWNGLRARGYRQALLLLLVGGSILCGSSCLCAPKKDAWTELYSSLPVAQQAAAECRWDDALRLFQNADTGKNDVQGRLARLGKSLCQQYSDGGEGEPSQQWAALALHADNAGAQAHYLLALEALEQRQPLIAWNHLVHALAIRAVPDRAAPILTGLVSQAFSAPLDSSDTPDYRKLLGWAKLLSVQVKEGIGAVEPALKGMSWDARCTGWILIGQEMDRQGNAQAHEAYNRAVQAAGEAGDVCLLAEDGLGWISADEKANEAAELHLSRYVTEGAKVLWPISVDRRIPLAERLFQRKAYREALVQYRAIARCFTKEHPHYMQTMYHYGLAANEEREWLESARVFGNVAAEGDDPSLVGQAAFYYVDALEQTPQWPDWQGVGKTLEHALTLVSDPQAKSDLALRYANTLVKRKKLDEALIFVQTFITNEKLTGNQVGPLRMWTASWLDDAARYDEALQVCQQYIQQYPNERRMGAWAYMRMAYAYAHSSRYEEARRVYEKVAGDYKEFPRTVALAKSDLAYSILTRQGKFAEAARITSEAAELLPASDSTRVTLAFRTARYLERDGQIQEALKAYRAVPSRPSNEDLVEMQCNTRLGIARCEAMLRGETAVEYGPQGPAGFVQRVRPMLMDVAIGKYGLYEQKGSVAFLVASYAEEQNWDAIRKLLAEASISGANRMVGWNIVATWCRQHAILKSKLIERCALNERALKAYREVLRIAQHTPQLPFLYSKLIPTAQTFIPYLESSLARERGKIAKKGGER